MENRKLLIKLFEIELTLSVIQFIAFWPLIIIALADRDLIPTKISIYLTIAQSLFWFFIFPAVKFKIASRMNYYECAKIYWWRGQRNWAVYNVFANSKGGIGLVQFTSFYLKYFSRDITKTYSGLLMLPFFELYEVLGCIIILNKFKKGKITTWDFNLRFRFIFKKEYGWRYKKLANLFGDRPEFNPSTKTYDEIEKFYDSELGKKIAQQTLWHTVDKILIGDYY